MPFQALPRQLWALNPSPGFDFFADDLAAKESPCQRRGIRAPPPQAAPLIHLRSATQGPPTRDQAGQRWPFPSLERTASNRTAVFAPAVITCTSHVVNYQECVSYYSQKELRFSASPGSRSLKFEPEF